jgi:hypothetical protein
MISTPSTDVRFVTMNEIHALLYDYDGVSYSGDSQEIVFGSGR